MTTEQVNQLLMDAVIAAINPHRGREHAISRHDLLIYLAESGQPTDERVVRRAIHELREAGNLIGSSGGVKGGYWIMESWPEVDDWCEREVRARALDLMDQARIIRKAAARKIGPHPVPQQLGLPIG
jgi:hypothetical protein